jgi:hypothetical protein
VVEFRGQTKKPAGGFAGGLRMILDLCALHQATAVRRHGMSMMMGMAKMADALHLFETVKADPPPCQIALHEKFVMQQWTAAA